METGAAKWFGRPINDPKNIGNNPTPTTGIIDYVGDPTGLGTKQVTSYTVDYELTSLVLEKHAAIASGGLGWVKVAETGPTSSSGNGATLYGCWNFAKPHDAPANSDTAAQTNNKQTKLMLNAKSPFNYASVASRKWEEWLSTAYSEYPCVPTESGTADAFTQPFGTYLDSPYEFDNPAFELSWYFPYFGGLIAENDETVQGVLGPIDRGLLISSFATISPGPAQMQITPPAGVTEVTIRVGSPAVLIETGTGKFWGEEGSTAVPVDLGDVLNIAAFHFDASTGTRIELQPPVIDTAGGISGMGIADSAELIPLVPASMVELKILNYESEGPPGSSRVDLYDSTGTLLSDSPGDLEPNQDELTIRVKHKDIGRIVITNTSVGLEGIVLLDQIQFRSPVNALAMHASSPDLPIGVFQEQDGLIQIKADDLGVIYLSTVMGAQYTISELSLPSRTDQVIQHMFDSLAQFQSEDAIFEPETDYRLTITTSRKVTPTNETATKLGIGGKNPIVFAETSYFRTSAPPGIGVPSVSTVPNSTDTPTTGFEDLSFYVKDTVPEVPPADGGHRSPGRAFYRAYDANVEFSPDTIHVNTMYRLDRRSLTLRLFDTNNLPLRDEFGRVLLADSQWGQSNDPTLSASAQKWIGMLNAASCRPSPAFDPSKAVRSEVVAAPHEQVLRPELLYQARLVPMLLHEAFVNGRAGLIANGQELRLERWSAENAGGEASEWVVKSETTSGGDNLETWYVTESTGVATSLLFEGSLVRINDTGNPDHPSQWSDFRALIQIRVPAGDAGLEVRRSQSTDLIRVVLSRTSDTEVTVRLSVVSSGTETVRRESSQSLGKDDDAILVAECFGAKVDVFLQQVGQAMGSAVLSINDAPGVTGGLALYSNGSSSARFTDVQVHDLKVNPTTAYRFDFITSKYADFNHHLNSYDPSPSLTSPCGPRNRA